MLVFTVIKTLALPILTQVLSVLPNSPKETFIDIQNIFFRFVWNNKRDKIKLKVIMNNYEEGGLKLPYIESYCYALKMSWIQKLLDPMNHSQWKLLLSDKIEKIGGDKVWLLKKVGIEKISTKFNPFWRDIFLIWSKILEGEEVNVATHVKCQPIWLNPSITINRTVVLNEKWQEKGIFFINDMKTNGNGLMSVVELDLKYQIHVCSTIVYQVASRDFGNASFKIVQGFCL